MKGVLNSIGVLEFITVELKFAVSLDSSFIVILVKNGHLGSVFVLGLSNGLSSNGIIILISSIMPASASWWMARYGQEERQSLQPAHRSGSMKAVMASSSIRRPGTRRAIASPTAARALVTACAASQGPGAEPARKIPSEKVDTGASLGWRSRKKPSFEHEMLKVRRTSS